jgi:plasminogen activator inhibitor 1 RNA-binding protein
VVVVEDVVVEDVVVLLVMIVIPIQVLGKSFAEISLSPANPSLHSDQEKQAAHGWGANNGNAEWADENAGEAIAQAEVKNEPGFTPDTNAADPAFSNGPDGIVGEDGVGEAEEKTKSYEEYLAELAEKKLALGAEVNVRKPNEGSKQSFPEGKALAREEENFFIGTGGKAKKAKEVGDKKERLALDGNYYQAPDTGDRGGRGGRGRGGGGRGGRGEFRGEGRGRGGSGRGRGDRGDLRGGSRGDRAPRGGFNAQDQSAFPALGA